MIFKIKNRIKATGNPIANGFNFFTLPLCAFKGALGLTPINNPRTLQHIYKPAQAIVPTKYLQKNCNLAYTPLLVFIDSLLLKAITIKNF